jgi:prepilin-type processing-associated H-X9-DG protein
MNNLRQLELAGQVYAGDYFDFLAPNREAGSSPISSTAGGWVLGNARRDASEANLKQGVLWRYTGAIGTYKCPADRSTVIGQPAVLRLRSYSLSGLLHDYPGTPWLRGEGTIDKYTQAANPAGIFGFICEGDKTISCGGYWCTEYYDWAVWYNIPSMRHSRGGNLAFLDGHTEHRRWKCEGRERRSWSDMPPTPQRATDKGDQEDLMWLVQRTPYWYWAKRNGPHF